MRKLFALLLVFILNNSLWAQPEKIRLILEVELHA